MVEGYSHNMSFESTVSSGISQNYGIPFLEDDHVADTQKFIERIDKFLIEYMMDKTERLGKEDVEEQDRRFVDPFICPICLTISYRSIQCADCKQIFFSFWSSTDSWPKGTPKCCCSESSLLPSLTAVSTR